MKYTLILLVLVIAFLATDRTVLAQDKPKDPTISQSMKNSPGGVQVAGQAQNTTADLKGMAISPAVVQATNEQSLAFNNYTLTIQKMRSDAAAAAAQAELLESKMNDFIKQIADAQHVDLAKYDPRIDKGALVFVKKETKEAKPDK